jgi:hypothetical protein
MAEQYQALQRESSSQEEASRQKEERILDRWFLLFWRKHQAKVFAKTLVEAGHRFSADVRKMRQGEYVDRGEEEEEEERQKNMPNIRETDGSRCDEIEARDEAGNLATKVVRQAHNKKNSSDKKPSIWERLRRWPIFNLM